MKSYCSFVLVVCFTFELVLFAVAFLSKSKDDETTEEAKNVCKRYRELARLPNPKSTRGSVCCENVTCFFNDLHSPWGHVSELPDCVDQILPTFSIYVSESANSSFVFDYASFFSDEVRNLTLNIQKQFFVIVHGFNTKWRASNWVLPMKNALLDLGHNVMIVNWTNGSNVNDYIKAVANTRTVGIAVKNVLEFMNNSHLINLDNTTIIGFSLGAHVAGYAGRNLNHLARIIGLDPAGPLFVCENIQARLDKGDANFVVAIHTNGDSVFNGGLGTIQPMGHLDFYPNGGIVQKGCETLLTGMAKKVLSFDFTHLNQGAGCSHKRAAQLFVEIIRQNVQVGTEYCKYQTFPCNETGLWKAGECFTCGSSGCPMLSLGIDSITTPQQGTFYFNTLSDDTESGKFCGQQFKISLTSDEDIRGQIVVTFKTTDGLESNPVLFQKEWKQMKANEEKSEIIVLPWNFVDITQILLTYKKLDNPLMKLLRKKNKFNMINATLVATTGVKMSICSPVEVVSSETVELTLKC